MNKNTAHSNCSHEATKSARAKCRRQQQSSPITEKLIAEAPARARKSAESATSAELAEYRRLIAELEAV